MLSTYTTPAAFRGLLAFLLVGNLLDASLTALWVSGGIVEEGNAIMAAALGAGFGPFVLSKVALVGLGVAALYRMRWSAVARAAVVPAALLYSFVLGNHLGIGARVFGLVERGILFGGSLPT